MLQRVVVTGLGCYTPLGATLNESWTALLNGRSGVISIQSLKEYEDRYKPFSRIIPPTATVGKVDFNPHDHSILTSQEIRRTSLASQVAVVATHEALSSANLIDGSGESLIGSHLQPERAGCIIGSGLPSMHDIFGATNSLLSLPRTTVSPYFLPKSLNNMACGNVAIKYKLRGVSHCPSTACATGNNAIGDAYNFIRLGYADMIVAGASEMSVHPLPLAGFIKAKSITPTGISRPFDSLRDGFVLGEGCGMAVLESLSHALKRKANIIAEVVGYGLSTDAYHITSPLQNGDGARRAMEMAIRQGMRWEDRNQIGYVNAHATSTVLGDRAEAQAIKNIFQDGNAEVCIGSNKGHMGHLLGAAGAVEAVFSLRSLKDGIVPNTLNLNIPGGADGDKETYFTGLQFVMGKPKRISLRYVLNNSFGFGGINSSLLFKKFE
ncbi:fatty acid synthase CEM1 Ecym_4333 [Eremothecium cymbalariae DBVPG|uniref:beta-ketoacyl-[acyl-carrier-protein] synthase I n=1 Tax=Eremothecium cymbalariae (strain CBS 270.75 / DBVPG 7215 / KCTC 17166 / NRRL Y-17582) TaxID=931890 RepID=G8JTP2_ERECY|nr:hypothetical protein Ecym_4333 [Eremothecium cymbalariae DBVPG\